MQVQIGARKSDVQALWAYCFDDDQSFIDWFFANRYQDANTLLCEDGSLLLGAAQLIRYPIYIRDRVYDSDYVVGVSVSPAHRSQGVGRFLLQEILVTCRSRAVAFAPLYPFSFGYYEKYGWAACNAQAQFNLPISALAHIRSSNAITARPLCAQDAPTLLSCYEEFSKCLSGSTHRDTAAMTVRLEESMLSGHAYGFFVKQECVAVVLYEMSQRVLTVSEMFYRAPSYIPCVFHFLSGHASTIDRVVFHAPLSHRTELFLRPDALPFSVVFHTMNRIVDVRLLAISTSTPIIIHLLDSLAPWNDGVFSLGPDGFSPSTQSPQLTMSIGVLAQCVTGFISPQRAAEHNLISVHTPSALIILESALPSLPTYGEEKY